MTISAVSGNANSNATAAQAVTLTGPGPTGVSSIASSISSSSGDHSCSAQISTFVENVVNAIRSCLSNLPWIGTWFELSAASSQGLDLSVSTEDYTDDQLLGVIRGLFPPLGTTGAVVTAIPPSDSVSYAIELFGRIQDPAVKMLAFSAVLEAGNSTDPIARQFYDALPEGEQGSSGADKLSFRRQLWLSNHRSDNGLGLHFGQHVIDTSLRAALAQQAARDLHVALDTAAATE